MDRDAYERGYEEARETYEAYLRTLDGARIWNAWTAVMLVMMAANRMRHYTGWDLNEALLPEVYED